MMKHYKVGDEVYIDGYTSFCDPGYRTVESIEKRFDERTGIEYQLIITESGSAYRSDTGACVKGAAMYYMVIT